jgi:6-phosphogluconolactonase
MKVFFPVLFAVSLFAAPALFAGGGTVVYVAEGGHHRVAVYGLDEEKGALTRLGDVELAGSPGALALSHDRRHLYAAVRSDGTFSTLAIDPETGLLTLVSTVPAAGAAAFVQPDRTGRWLLAAYYNEGLVSVSRIGDDGAIADEPLWTLDIGAKAHCLVTDPSNRFAFCPHPMDLNCVDQFLFDETSGQLTLNMPPTLAGEPGAGPRHLRFHSNGKWVYVVNEQGKSVTFCHFDENTGTLAKRQTLSTHPKDWYVNWGSCAEMRITEDGRFLYASNRGHESIAAFAIDAASGELTALGRTPTEKIPRSFDIMPGGEFIVVAGQGEGRLVLYRRDVTSGALTELERLECGKSPVWVMGMRLP